MPIPEPEWLDVTDVQAWLRSRADAAAADMDLITRCAAAAEPQVERARPDQFEVTPGPEGPVATFVPDAEVYQAAVMLAARVVRRRNTPSGIETMADTVSYVTRYDPEIERALRTGAWQVPAVG